MPELLIDEGRDYRRYRHTPEEKQQLSATGLQFVLSSNVSALGRSGDNLTVRFHNGSVYTYLGAGEEFAPMLRSNSKGRYLWSNIRDAYPYARTGTISFPTDPGLSDEELFRDIEEKAKLPEILEGVELAEDIEAAEATIRGVVRTMGTTATFKLVSQLLPPSILP